MKFQIETPTKQRDAVLVGKLDVGDAGIGLNSRDLYIRTRDGCLRYRHKTGTVETLDSGYQTVIPVRNLTFTWE